VSSSAARRVGPEVDVCGLDGVKQQLRHSGSLHVDEVGLEESLGGPEPLPAHLHLPAVRELHHREETDCKKYTYSFSYKELDKNQNKPDRSC